MRTQTLAMNNADTAQTSPHGVAKELQQHFASDSFRHMVQIDRIGHTESAAAQSPHQLRGVTLPKVQQFLTTLEVSGDIARREQFPEHEFFIELALPGYGFGPGAVVFQAVAGLQRPHSGHRFQEHIHFTGVLFLQFHFRARV